MPNGLFYINSLDRSISNIRGVWLISIITIFDRNSCIKCSVNPDQTPRSAASDLGLHCLPMSLKWDAGHKWVDKVKRGVNRGIHYYTNFLKFSDFETDFDWFCY